MFSVTADLKELIKSKFPQKSNAERSKMAAYLLLLITGDCCRKAGWMIVLKNKTENVGTFT